MTIPNIPVVGGESIPFIQVNGSGIKLIQNVRPSNIGVGNIADASVWMINAPSVIPPTVPVTTVVGTPIVNMPGCVKVHKENAKNPKNKNKILVDDDPKGNTVLCDAGAPYYEPAEYDYRGLTWQDLSPVSDEVPEGVDTGEPPAPEIPDPPGAPASHNTVLPLGSSSTSILFLFFGFFAFSLCTFTQPGILTIGVPTSIVTGTVIGNALGD